MNILKKSQLVLVSLLLVSSCSEQGFTGGGEAAKKDKTPGGSNTQVGQPTSGGSVPSGPNGSTPLGGNSGDGSLVTKTLRVHFQRVGQNDAGLRCAVFQSNAQTANVGCNNQNSDNWADLNVHPASCNFFSVSMTNGGTNSGSTMRSTDNPSDLQYINFTYSASTPNQFIIKMNDNNDSTDPNDMHKFADFYYKIEFFEKDGITPASNIGVKNFPNAGCQK